MLRAHAIHRAKIDLTGLDIRALRPLAIPPRGAGQLAPLALLPRLHLVPAGPLGGGQDDGKAPARPGDQPAGGRLGGPDQPRLGVALGQRLLEAGVQPGAHGGRGARGGREEHPVHGGRGEGAQVDLDHAVEVGGGAGRQLELGHLFGLKISVRGGGEVVFFFFGFLVISCFLV